MKIDGLLNLCLIRIGEMLPLLPQINWIVVPPPARSHQLSGPDYTWSQVTSRYPRQPAAQPRPGSSSSSRRPSDPRWLEENESAVLPYGCLDSEKFWEMAIEFRDYYKKEVNNLLGYVPTPYLKPRERDLPAIQRGREARDRRQALPLPPLTLPEAVGGQDFRRMRDEVRQGLRYGKL